MADMHYPCYDASPEAAHNLAEPAKTIDGDFLEERYDAAQMFMHCVALYVAVLNSRDVFGVIRPRLAQR